MLRHYLFTGWWVAWSVGVVAQVAPGNPVDWTTIIAAYGVAAPLVGYLVWTVVQQNKTIRRLEERNWTLVDASINKLAPLTTEAANVLAQAVANAPNQQELANQIEDLSARFDPTTLRRIARALDRLVDLEDRRGQ